MAIKFLNTVDTDVAFVSKGGSYSATNETKTDVAISVLQNNKIYSETSSGYLRNLIYHDSNGSIQIGQDGTALITDIIMKPGTSGNVIFRTQSNSETVRITSTGNVGIGTTSPTSELHVEASDNPNLLITRGGVNKVLLGDSGSNNGGDLLLYNADGTLKTFIRSGASSYLNGGNVGIGTTSPDVRLEVVEASPTDGIIADFVNSTNAGGTTAAIKLSNADSEACDVVLGANRVGANFGSDFFISLSDGVDGSNQERFRITEAGNVGIGTTTPDTRLDVEAATNPTIRITNSTSVLGAADVGSLEFFTKDISTDASRVISSIVCVNDGDSASVPDGQLVFKTALGGANKEVATERMRIDSVGNVGIGTTSPDVKLDVKSSATTAETIAQFGNSNIQGGLKIKTNGNLEWGLETLNARSLTFGTNNEERMRIDSAGNVGIGTTTPAEKLHVEGNVYMGAPTGSSRTVYTGGDANLHLQTNTGDVKILSGFGANNLMTLKAAGNVGIGTTSPETTLSVVGATSTNDLIGGSINLATSSGWVIPSGAMSTRVGYYGGDFTLNGATAENGMEWGLGPFNDRQLLWTTTGSTDSNQDGGWNKTLTNLDIESPYLSVVYFKRVSSNASGNFYHGTGNNILNLDGTSNTNPYFQVRALSLFDQDVWYASVGVIQSNSDSNTTAYADISGLYRLDTGVKVVNSNAFKFDSTGATLSRGHRTYLYYSTDVDVVGQFANPGFYKIDGDQPKLHDIVGGDSDDVFWSANGNDIYNDNSGNVGIGTTTPAYTLQVGDGTEDSIIAAYYSDGKYTKMHGYGLYMSRTASYIRPVTSTIQSLFVGAPGQIWNAISHDANTHLFLTGGTEHMRVASSGNVGIGTTSPDAKLDIEGDEASLRIKDTTSGKAWDWQVHAGYMEFGEVNVANNRLVIKNGGNVGIGTTNPGYPLVVNGEIEASGDGYLMNGYAWAYINPSATVLTLGDWDGNEFPTRIMDEYSNEVLRVANGGVGIGTTSPNTPLEVTGGISTTSSDFVIASTGERLLLQTAPSPYSYSYIQATSAGGSLVSAALALQPDGGNVGIATTSPGSKLDIVGATNASDSSLLRVRTTNNPNAPEKVVGFYVNTSTERGFISVNQYQTAYSTSSDYRLKENIVPIPNSIERLKELKPCRFNFIQGDPNHVVDGFIAHEAAEVIPEAVTGEKDAVDEDNNPSYQGIDQGKIVPLLTAALQEAINKIEQLEKRIQTLENN